MKTYDLVVIGGGPGGYVAAIRAAQVGLKVACIEAEHMLGGTCLRVGCIPSKALLESSAKYAEAKERLRSHGVITGEISLDLATLMKRKDRIVRTLAAGVEYLFKKNNVKRYKGIGRLSAPNVVEVIGDESESISAKNVIVATGSRPSGLPGVVFGSKIGTSNEALSYNSVPDHLVVIGAGAIGLELGSVWRRLGSRVTVFEYLDRILPGVDSDIAFKAQKALEKQGFKFYLRAKVLRAYEDQNGCVVEVEGMESVRCDRVLVAVGRSPFTDGLGAEKVGLEIGRKGFIVVNKNFESNVPGIFAIGDVIGPPMLAHKAHEEAIAVVEYITKGYCHVDYEKIPAVCYTEPEVATVGFTEDALRDAGIPYRVGRFPFRANGRALTMDETEGEVKVLAHAKTDRILGVHIIGPRASELIAEATAAMAFGASSEDLARVCHAHPTLPEALREAALSVLGPAIHI